MWDYNYSPICSVCNNRVDNPPLIRIHIRIEQPPSGKFNDDEDLDDNWNEWEAELNDTGYESDS